MERIHSDRREWRKLSQIRQKRNTELTSTINFDGFFCYSWKKNSHPWQVIILYQNFNFSSAKSSLQSMDSSAENWKEQHSPWNGLIEEEYCCLYWPFHSPCHYLSMAIRLWRSRAVKGVLPKGGMWLHARLHRQLHPVWKLFLSQNKLKSRVFKRSKMYRCCPSMTSKIALRWTKFTPNELIVFIRI